ncbi:hypothetical protein QUA_0913 [Clostridioides difficile P49]|nr:hypothetical protein QUA_0913 [Clostridioides difficile P49]
MHQITINNLYGYTDKKIISKRYSILNRYTKLIFVNRK